MSLNQPEALALLLLAAPIVYLFYRRPPLPLVRVSSLLLARALGVLPVRRKRIPRDEWLSLSLILGGLAFLTLALSTRAPPVKVLWVAEDGQNTQPPEIVRAAQDLIVVGTSPPRTVAHRYGETPIPHPIQASAGDAASLVQYWCSRAEGNLVVIDQGAVSFGFPIDGCAVSRPAIPTTIPTIEAFVAGAPTSTGDTTLHLQTRGASGNAHIFANDVPLGDIVLSGTPDGRAEAVARFTAPPGSALTATLDGAPAPASLQLPPATALRTLIRTPAPDGFLATLASLHPRVQSTVVPADAPLVPGTWDLIVAEGATKLPEQAQWTAIWGAPPEGVATTARQTAKSPLPTVVEPEHPLFDFADLSTLHIASSSILAAPPGSTVLVSSDAGPLVVEVPATASSPTHWVFFGFPLTETDLPLRPEFIHLFANLVDLAAPPPAPPSPAPTQRPLQTAPASGPPVPTLPRSVWPWMALLAFCALLAETLWVTRRNV